MSNKKRKPLPFIPAEFPEPGMPEVPNYVIPTTDLEYKELAEQTGPCADECAEDCGEDLGR